MKRIFLDTNVILDFILERDGADDASDILSMGENNEINLFVSVLTIANIAYIVSKGHTKEELYSFLADLTEVVHTLPMNEEQVKESLTCLATDFEDVLQYVCAKSNDSDIIITRNTKHFRFSKIPVLSPKEFLNIK